MDKKRDDKTKLAKGNRKSRFCLSILALCFCFLFSSLAFVVCRCNWFDFCAAFVCSLHFTCEQRASKARLFATPTFCNARFFLICQSKKRCRVESRNWNRSRSSSRLEQQKQKARLLNESQTKQNCCISVQVQFRQKSCNQSSKQTRIVRITASKQQSFASANFDLRSKVARVWLDLRQLLCIRFRSLHSANLQLFAQLAAI